MQKENGKRRIDGHHDICKSISESLDAKLHKVNFMNKRKHISPEEFAVLIDLYEKIISIDFH